MTEPVDRQQLNAAWPYLAGVRFPENLSPATERQIMAMLEAVNRARPALPAPEPPRLNDMSVEDILDYYGVPPGGDPWHRINELGQMYRRALQKSGASALELLRRVVEVDHGADGLHGTIAAAKELLARAALPAEHAPPDGPWSVMKLIDTPRVGATTWNVTLGYAKRGERSYSFPEYDEARSVCDALNGGSRPALAGRGDQETKP